MVAKLQNAEIADVLRKEVGLMHNIWFNIDQFIMETADDNLEEMGSLVQKVQKVIENHFPKRERNIFLIIRNTTNKFENKIKIWKSL